MLARSLVPGDIVYLSTGDRVPADIRLFEVKLNYGINIIDQWYIINLDICIIVIFVHNKIIIEFLFYRRLI